MVRRRYKRKPFKPIDYERFKETRLLAGLSKRQVASFLFVSLRTIQYWERGKIKIPYAAFRLLRISTGYELPGSPWRGWMLFGDTLISPEGKKFTPGDLNHLSLTFAIAHQWRKEYIEKQSREREAKANERSGEASILSTLSLINGGKA